MRHTNEKLENYYLFCVTFLLFLFKAAKTGYSDDFTLDDRFVSSAANKISPADQEQRAKQRAIRGLLCQTVTGDASIKLIVIQVRLVSYCSLAWQTGQK